MSDTPQDPSQNSIDQGERHEETFEGQEGYGVDYEDGRLEGADVQTPPPAGRLATRRDASGEKADDHWGTAGLRKQ